MKAHPEHDKINVSKVKNKKGGFTMKRLSITIIAAVIIVGMTAAPARAQSSGIYIVQPGDTLLKIAASHAIRVSQLAEANGLRWNSWVYVGQRLVIPDPQPIPNTVYVVRRGDTLFSIARRSGTTVQAIMWTNGLTGSRIYTGQRLLIPALEASCPAAPPQRVRVGESARVCTAYDPLIVRAQPGRNSVELTRLWPGTYVLVIDGPACANASSWWRVRTDSGTVGWVAEGSDAIDPYFLCPVR
jgi:LysM repeat protein